MHALTLTNHSAMPTAPVLTRELGSLPQHSRAGRCSIRAADGQDEVQVEGRFQRYSTPGHAEILIFLLGYHDDDPDHVPALDIALRMRPDWGGGSGNFILGGIAVANASVESVEAPASEL
jgi:hypothetical protein